MSKAKNGRVGKNHWYVITGGPCSGKTTVVNMLSELGYKTTVEDARYYIDMQLADGKTVEQIRKNQREFQLKVLEIQIAQERSLSPEDLVFLDRAIPDALAYYRFLDLSPDQVLTNAMEHLSYRKIFILDPLPLIDDYARREDPAAQIKIHKLIWEVYRSLPFPIVEVPVLPPDERISFILSEL